MAATVQIGNSATTTKTTGNNNPPIGGGGVGVGGNPAPSLTQNPRLKRIVYSKYRELLGSYNDKANAIIETLPAYMVHEDRGFQGFEPRLGNDEGTLIYGTSTASTMSGGNPSQRQPYEAPACVQNAMMTKDKKPFTYTPGGIDLSQIKSERMAKRLARNAQAEGATGASQINRPTQQPGSPCASPAAASIGAAAMGMPFQVFPAGPTPPPASPATGKQHTPPGSVVSAAAPLPPPPPPPSSNTLAPSTNRGGALAPGSPNAARKSPTPQRFEPPPLGFRPEIKIPPNPMAALKKITPPVEKNSFWVDEYRKERSKSPMVNANEINTENIPNGGPEAATNNDDVNKKSSSTETTAQEPTINNINHNNNNINNNYQQYSPPTQQSYSPKIQQQQEKPQQSPPLAEFRSVAPPQSPAVHVYTLQQPQQQFNEAARGPNSAMQPQRTTESPFKYAQQQQQRPVQPSSPLAHQQQQQPSAPSPTNSTSSSNGSKSGQTVPWRTQRGPQPPQAQLQQQQQQKHPQPIYNNVKSRDVYSPAPEGPKPTNVGSLYIAPLDQPIEPQAQNIVRQQQILQQQQQQMQEQQQRQPPTARWMSSTQPVQKEQPAWARPEENGNVVPSSLQRIKSPPPAAANTQQHRPIQGNGYANSQDFGGHAPSHSTGLRLQINTGTNNQSGAPKERIIPIQLEQTPTPTQTPAQSNFGPQPHYNNNSINNGTGSVAPSSYVMRSPNQFVDQGYNNYSDLPPPQQQQQQQQQQPLHLHVASPQQQYTNNSDINNGGGPKTRIIPVMIEGQSGARGPISQSPIVIQNDQRTPPVQSKSFRILQKITDTIGDDGNTVAGVPTSAPVEGFADAEPQLQRPQYARQMSAQQARKSPNIDQMKRMQIAQDQQQLWPQDKNQNDPLGKEKLYTGPENPSKTFQKLQKAIETNTSKYSKQNSNNNDHVTSNGNTVIKQQQQQPQQQQLNKYPQHRTIYNEDIPQQYVHPSEQQVPEPKKYTGSAIPSRSFKILQAMTTPENAAETEGSDSNIVELNETRNQKNNPNPNPNQIPNLHQNQSVSNINTTNCKNCSSATPHPHSAPPSSSSNSSLSSESSSSHAHPSHYHPCSAYPPYAWCPQILPTGGHVPYSYPVPLPPTNVETTPNWPYPYPMPPPGDNAPHQHYQPYPYYFPYFPPPMHALHAHQTSSPPSISSLEYDTQYAYDPNGYPFLPAQAYHPYPFANITAYTRHLNPARRAISVLPDIIVTPSTDEIPHTSIQYKNPTKTEREQRDQTKVRAKSVDVSEIYTLKARTNDPIPREKREGSVIDMLEKRLNEIKNSAAESTSSSESKTKYVGELEIGCNQKSPSGDISSSESSSDSSDRDEVTPKVDLKAHQSLQAIKSVTNVQIYNGNTLEENEDEDDEDEDDVTSADGESDIFDEEGEGEVVADLELDECIEEDDEEDDYLLETEELSVIYEEESEMEKSSDQRTALNIDTSSNSSQATTINNKYIEEEIEENDDEDSDDDESLVDDEGAEDSSSVTVRLPLKFSFSRSSNDENIATVEVGNSQIEEANSMNIEEKWNSFSVTSPKAEKENGDAPDGKPNYDDDRDVSVTVSLTPSSQGKPVDRNTEPKPETIKSASQRLTGSSTVHDDGECEPQSSQEDVSVSFSLNMRNKFLNQTINGEVTNIISDLKKSSELNTIKENKLTSEDEPVEEVDFFATLRATKMQAQKSKEQSASYWGKTTYKNTQSTTIETKESKTTETGVNLAVKDEVIDNIWTNIDDDLTKFETPEKKSKKISAETSEKVSERSFGKANALVKEDIIDNIWANINEDIKKLESPKKTTKNKKVESTGKTSIKNLTKSNTPLKDKITDHPLISKTEDTEKVVPTKKAGTLETARNNFWSAVEETIKEPSVIEYFIKEESHKHGTQESQEKLENSEQWMSKEKKIPCSQFVKEKLHHINVKAIMLKSRMETLPQKQNAEITRSLKINEKKELNGSCCPSIDPAEEIRETSPSKDAVFPNNSENNEINFWSTVSETPQISKSEEVEVDFWAEIEKSKSISKEYQSTCDLVECPEEPREVDTDEEIDFWVEIEANNNRNNDAVTFQKAASFWASRDRQNSVEETPYKPLTQTPFPAKLPDEPCINIDSWTVAALEAARGEEPEIIDPAVEEEKMLAQEFNQMPEAKFAEAGKIEETNATQNNSYMEAPIDADLPAEEEEEPDFWAIINSEKEKASKKVSDKEELEIKRSNYRKAMAFFTTSIDEHREKAGEHREVEATPICRNTPVCEEPEITKNNNNIENGTENLKEVNEIEESEEEDDDSDEEEGESESEPNIHDRNSTPTNLESKLLTIQPTIEEIKHDARTITKLPSTDLPDQKVSVRDRIFAFESGAMETPESKQLDAKKHSLSVEGYNRKSSLSRNSSCQRSESEMEEDDSGVTDMNKQLSETDTESESFPELRKMTSYQRAATHSRLFKLLQDENDEDIAQKATQTKEELHMENELQLKPSRRKIVHNVSVTRRQNPNVLQEAETMSQRRERLSLPLRQKNSIDADNPSTPNSPASPIQGQPSSQRLVSDKLVNELVQSLLLKRDSSHLRNMPMEKLQAAAKLVLEEELDSSLLESMDSESLDKAAVSDKLAKTDSSYTDYYNSWSAAVGSSDIVPSKAFRALQDRPKRSPWSVKCPRVLSSKTINRDLTRVTESPEILVKGSKSPEHFAREGSVSKWKKF